MNGFPRDRDTLCPPWCELPAGHVASPDFHDQQHSRTVAEIDIPEIDGLRSAGEKPVTVRIDSWVDWDRKEWPASISLTLAGTSGTDDEQGLTADEARALAAALQRAADLIADS